MKLKDFIVEKKQIIIECENYNYEIIDMETVFAELLAESPLDIKCIGNIALVSKLLTLLGKDKSGSKTLALADKDNLNDVIAFNNEQELNYAVTTTLINSKKWKKIVTSLKKKFTDIDFSKWTNDPTLMKTNIITTTVSNSCDFTKEVIELTNSTFIMVWKDGVSHIPGEVA